MCQDCYSPDSYADDDLGYDDQDDDWGDDGYYADELDDSHYDEDDGDDRYDEFKDGVAMGYLNPDGSQREPDPPDGYDPWDYRLSRRQRFRRVLRTLLPRRRAVINRERYDDEPPFLGGKGLNDGLRVRELRAGSVDRGLLPARWQVRARERPRRPGRGC